MSDFHFAANPFSEVSLTNPSGIFGTQRQSPQAFLGLRHLFLPHVCLGGYDNHCTVNLFLYYIRAFHGLLASFCRKFSLSNTIHFLFASAHNSPCFKGKLYKTTAFAHSQTTTNLVKEAITGTVGRDRKIQTVPRTNQIAGFVTVSSWNKIKSKTYHRPLA